MPTTAPFSGHNDFDKLIPLSFEVEFGRAKCSGFPKKTNLQRNEKKMEELLKSKLIENVRDSKESKSAVAYCEWAISEYDGLFEHNEKRWYIYQKIIIIWVDYRYHRCSDNNSTLLAPFVAPDGLFLRLDSWCFCG
jgi:hypothetical protein